MPLRLAGAMSLIVFAFCLIVGAFGAQNGFATVVYRAMVAMAGTFLVSLVIGRMASAMIEENVKTTVASSARKIEEIPTNSLKPGDR